MENCNQNDEMLSGGLTENGSQSNWNYDPVTGKPFNGHKTYGNQNNAANTNHEENVGGARDLCIAAFCCFIIGNLLLFTPVALLAGVVLIAGFVSGIIAVVKYPGSTFAKILTVLFIVESILVIIFVIYVIYSCLSCFNGGWAGMS